MAMESSQRLTGLGGMSMKQLTLLILTLQSTAHVLMVHYSRIMPAVTGQRYFIPIAVLMGEVIKLTVSLTLALSDIASNPKSADTSTAASLFEELAGAVFAADSWKMAIPAILFLVQNTMQYIAISNLDPATFQITNQLKIVTTAVFSMLFLGRTIDSRRWMSLGVLAFGILVVAISVGSAETPVLSVKDLREGSFHEARNIWDLQRAGNKAAKQLNKRSATYEGIEDDFAASNPATDATTGLLMSAISCLFSGFAGSLFEKTVKEPRNDHGTSIWVRNAQLSLFSLLPALLSSILLIDHDEWSEHGTFAGFDWAVWLAIILQAAGGLTVGMLVMCSNSMSKSISGGVSTILVFLVSLVLLDVPVNSYYCFGAAVTVSSLYVFNTSAEDSKARPPKIMIPDAEKSSGQPGYFDLESNMAPAKSPLRGDQLSLSTSRPGTPTYERRFQRTKSTDNIRLSKLHNG